MEITSYVKQILDFCAYRERSHQEVRDKIKSLGYDDEETEELIVFLIQENFLNELRFAIAYARGKFYHNKWGKMKIIRGLKQKDVSEPLIKKGLKEIDDDDYYNTLIKLIEQKNRDYRKTQIEWQRKIKIKRFLVGKGYEYHIIDEALADYFS